MVRSLLASSPASPAHHANDSPAHPQLRGFAGLPPQLAGVIELRAHDLSRVLPNSSAAARGLGRTLETTMFSLINITRTTQQFVCVALAALIVTMGLSLGAVAAQSAAHPGYSVTITQL